MKRTFFGMSANVRDTEWNRLLSDLLVLIEKKLNKLFSTDSSNYSSFEEWVAEASKARPEMKYLLDWIMQESRLGVVYLYELGEQVSDALLDEIDVAMLIIETMPEDLPADIICSEFADAINAFEYAFGDEKNKHLVSSLTEECSAFDIPMIPWTFEPLEEITAVYYPVPSEYEGAFSLSS